MAETTEFLTRLTENVSYIQQLGDNPNSDNGLTAAALKAWFDKAPEVIKAYLNNTFIPEIETKFGSMDAWIKEASDKIDKFTVGSGFLPVDGSVPMNGALDIGTHKVINVSAPEDEADAVNKKYVDETLASSVKTLNNGINEAKAVASSAASAASKAQTTADGKAAASGVTVTLSASGWSSKKQAVSASGVTSDSSKCHVVVSPVEASREAYNDAVIRCTAQGTNTLTFTCDDVPTADISVNVLILK